MAAQNTQGYTRSRGYDQLQNDPRYDYPRNRRSPAYDRGRDYPRRPPPKKEDTRSSAAAASVIGIILRVLLMIFIIAFFIMPHFAPYRNTFIDYLMAGLYKYEEVPDSVDFSVERVLTIESDDYLNYTLFLPIPQNIRIDGKDAQLLKDYDQKPRASEKLGGESNQWVWHEVLESGGKAAIHVIYYFRTEKISWDISIKKSGTIEDILTVAPNLKQRHSGDAWPVPDYQDSDGMDTDDDGIPDTTDVDDNNDNFPDKYRIEPSNPQIRELLLYILNNAGLYLGNDLSNIGHLNVYEVVLAIYNYIDDTCSYPTIDEMYEDARTYGGYPKWATGTLGDERGDCDDQSILFITLCRAAGIPAMLEIGALYDPQMDRWEGHGWANVLIPYSTEYRWEKGYDYVTPMVDIVNNIFLFRDPNRFSEWVDDGIKGKLNTTGYWNPSHLELRYLAWEYFYEGTSVDTAEAYITLEWSAKAPEKLYI